MAPVAIMLFMYMHIGVVMWQSTGGHFIVNAMRHRQQLVNGELMAKRGLLDARAIGGDLSKLGMFFYDQ